MSDDELNKLFKGVPSTELFRKFWDIVQKDIPTLKAMFTTLPTQLQIKGVELANITIHHFIDILEFIMTRFENDDPYKSLKSSKEDFKPELRLHNFNNDEKYSYYLNTLLPTFVGERYLPILWHDIRHILSSSITSCVLMEDMLQDEEIDFEDIDQLLQVLKDLINHFTIFLNATADYEKQLFG